MFLATSTVCAFQRTQMYIIVYWQRFLSFQVSEIVNKEWLQGFALHATVSYKLCIALYSSIMLHIVKVCDAINL